MDKITVINGVVHIPYKNIVNFAYNMLECTGDIKTFDELEQWHQAEVNLMYGKFTDKQYEEVPKEVVEKYEAYCQALIDEENEPWE